MAYGTKYYFEAPGLREAVYRLDLEKEGHTGGTQQITRDMASLSFEAGKEGLDFDASIQPSRAEIRLREQSIIQEVYGSPDRLWRATAHKKPPGGSYEQYFRGFVLGDMGRFDPGNFRAPFTLEAVDGLELLKNVARPRDGNTDKVSAFLLIQEALEEIEIGLDWALQWPWFYRLDNTTDSELVDGDEKLKTLYTWEDAHKIERSRPEGDGKLRDHYNILRRLLQTLNLRLVQSQGQWWVRQRHVGRYGAETTHHYTPGTDAVQNTTQEDLVWDLSAKSSRVEERPSRYRRNLGRYTVVHDFGPYTGRGLPESGLETLNNWTLTTPDPTEYDSIHESHNNIPVTPDETANNQKAVLGLPIYSAYPYFSPYLESDRFSFPSSTRRDEVLRLSFRHACQIRQEDFVQAVQLEHNGWWLQHKDSKIAEKVTRGEGVTVPLQNPLKAPIPKGTTLRVFSVDRSQQYPLDQTTELTLTETARTDDNALVGDLQDTIKPGDYTSGNPGIRYYTWQQSQTRAWFNHMYQEDNYATRELVTFMQDPSGTVVNGDDMKLWFAMLNRDNVNNDYFLDYGMVVDDISIELTVGDSVVSQAEHDTFTNAVQAQEKEQSTYLGDGPSADSKARLFYHDPSTGNSQHSLNEFGLDSWDSNTYQGLRLPHLRGREYLRELRTKHERYTLRVHLNDPSDVFGPHHILLWEGDLWSIEHYSHTPDNGYIDVEVMPLQDDGIAGLSYTSILTTGEEDSGGGSISSSQSAGGTGPSPVNQWQNIGGGVGDGLFVNSSGVLGVELDSDSFLNFDSNGILQAEVKDEDDMASDSADHLATQQSIKAYVDASNVTVDFAQDGSIDIDPLSKISTKGDANSIFQSGAGTGELLFDVSQKWPNADQLDGYEGSALAALAENETITGSWAHDNALTLNAGSVVKGGATGTDHFASKTTGWEVDYGGAADFRSIYADELVVQAFTADITQTLVGSQLITKSRARLASTFTVPASGDPPNTLHVEDIPQISGRVFTVGDTVRLRLVSRDGGGLTVADVWGTVDNYNSLNDGTQEWDFTTIDANGEAGASINEGSVALDYGQSGGIQGQIYSTVNDGSGAPYTDYRTWTDSGTDGKPDSFNIKARVGELDGIANANATGGGIYTSQGRFEEDVIVGDLSKTNQYLEYASGTLTLKGSLTITGGSGIGNLSDAGSLAEQDEADWSTDITGSGKPADNADVTGNNTAQDIVNLPASPGSAGFYATSTDLGFYNGSLWTVYMEDDGSGNGNFFLKGSGSQGLTWDGSAGTLTLTGSLTITGGSGIGNLTDAGSLAEQNNADWGSDVTGSGKPADNADVTGNNTAQDIDFLPQLPGSPSAGLYADSNELGFHDGTDWTVYIQNDSGTGRLYVKDGMQIGDSVYAWDSSSSTSGDDEIRISKNNTGLGTQNFVRMYQTPGTDTYGIEAKDSDNRTFHLGQSSGVSDNEIAGWNFDPSRLYKDLSGSNILLGIGEGSAFADVFDPRDGFFAIDTNTGALAGIGGKDNSDTIGVLVDNGNGDGSNGSYISMGNDHFRSSFGFTVFADGKTRMEVSASTSYVDDLELRNLDVTGTITVGDGNGNGKLTDPTGAYTLDEDGLTFSDDQAIASEVTWDDAGTEVGSITAFSFGSEYWTRIKAGDEIRLNANGGDVKLSVDAALDGLSFVSVRTSKLTASDLDKGDAVIYKYQGSNFGIHLRAAVKEASGTSPNFTDTAIAVAA